MIYYLRNKKNQNLFEIEFYTTESDGNTFHELHATVDIKGYSEFLLSQPAERQPMIIQLFDQLSEYRGWLWETYYMGRRNEGSDEDYNKITDHLNKLFKGLTEQFDLSYVSD
jgi:hypothetical protein